MCDQAEYVQRRVVLSIVLVLSCKSLHQSFLHKNVVFSVYVRACAMSRTFHSSFRILLPVLTPDNISGLQSVGGCCIAVKMKRRQHFLQVIQKFSFYAKVIFCQRLSSVKGCLPSKVVFCQKVVLASFIGVGRLSLPLQPNKCTRLARWSQNFGGLP